MLSSAAAWRDLEGITLSAITQMEKDKYCMISFVCVIQEIQLTSQRNRQEADSQIENKLVVTSEEGWGRRKRGVED